MVILAVIHAARRWPHTLRGNEPPVSVAAANRGQNDPGGRSPDHHPACLTKQVEGGDHANDGGANNPGVDQKLLFDNLNFLS